MSHSVYVVYHDIMTGYGHGPDICAENLLNGRASFRPITRFPVSAGKPDLAGLFPDEIPHNEEVFSILREKMPVLPADTPVYFALSLGDAEKLNNPEERWTSDIMMEDVLKILDLSRGKIYSAACASGNVAIGLAYSALRNGLEEQILVAGADFVSEFVYSGFFSVRAMSSTNSCRPYDQAHDGLLLGDAAGLVLLASDTAVKKNRWQPLCRISGFGISTDAHHIAAPDPSGQYMAQALRQAISEMEIQALRKVFPDGIPLVSVKGGTGHILAASGLVELSCAIEMLKRNIVFPQTGLKTPAPGAEKYVSASSCPLKSPIILTMNAGFGGINAVILTEGIE